MTSSPRLLPGELDGADDVAGEALEAQLVVELELERHRVRALALDLVALERLHRHEQVVGVELVVVARDRDPDRAPVAQRRGHV